MNENERKAELRKRRLVAIYPRRSQAQFSDANDHNPQVLQDCPECHGTGKYDQASVATDRTETYALEVCPACGGAGTTYEIESYFPTELPETSATPDSGGWLQCPGCGIKFTICDPHRWSGYRHLRCGQRIRIQSCPE